MDPGLLRGLGIRYLTTASFTLATCVRDAQENQILYAASTRHGPSASSPSTTPLPGSLLIPG